MDLENILFLPHYNFLKEKYNEKKLIYLTNNGVTGDGVNLPFKDLLTNEPFVVKNNAILYSKVELLRKNAVYGDDNDKFGFAPFVVLQTEENKKTAISERDLQRTFSYNKGKIIEYNEYLKELEIAKLSNIEREKKIIYEKVQNERNKLEKLKQLKIKYGDHFGSLISNEQLEIGMSKEMCNESIGNPYETKTVIRENLKYEICYYYGGFKLFFLNDELKQIEL